MILLETNIINTPHRACKGFSIIDKVSIINLTWIELTWVIVSLFLLLISFTRFFHSTNSNWLSQGNLLQYKTYHCPVELCVSRTSLNTKFYLVCYTCIQDLLTVNHSAFSFNNLILQNNLWENSVIKTIKTVHKLTICRHAENNLLPWIVSTIRALENSPWLRNVTNLEVKLISLFVIKFFLVDK